MKILYNLVFSIVLFLYSNLNAAKTIRNPFAFEDQTIEETIVVPPPVSDPLIQLSKWNIKAIDNDLFVIENPEDGQMRTIEISSFK